MPIRHAHRTDGCIHIVDTRLNGFEIGLGRQTGRCMALHVNRDLNGFLQAAHQLKGCIGRKQTRHVFDGNGISAHRFQARCHFEPAR